MMSLLAQPRSGGGSLGVGENITIMPPPQVPNRSISLFYLGGIRVSGMPDPTNPPEPREERPHPLEPVTTGTRSLVGENGQRDFRRLPVTNRAAQEGHLIGVLAYVSFFNLGVGVKKNFVDVYTICKV